MEANGNGVAAVHDEKLELKLTPRAFMCPITHELMRDPVSTVDGHVYERSAIEAWFLLGHRKSPMTGAPLPNDVLRHEPALRRAINEYGSLRPRFEKLETDCLSLHDNVAHLQDRLRTLAQSLQSMAEERSDILRQGVRDVAQELERLSSGGSLDAGTSSSAADVVTKGRPTAERSRSPSQRSQPGHDPRHVDGPLDANCVSTLQGDVGPVWSVSCLGDGLLASGSSDGSINVWDAATLCCTATLRGHEQGVCGLTCFGESRLASASTDGSVKLWNARGNSCIATLYGHGDGVLSVASITAWRLASGSDDRTIKVWDPYSRCCLATLRGHSGPVWSVSPLGADKLVSSSSDTSVKIWDLEAGRCINTLMGDKDWVQCACVLSPSTIASGSSNRTISVWDLGAARCRLKLRGHSGPVRALASVGRGLLASGSGDGTVKLWDAVAGSRCLATLEGHAGPVRGLATLAEVANEATPQLMSGSLDGSLKLWAIRTQAATPAAASASVENH